MQRLTISLDDELAEALDQLQEQSGESKANLLRRALKGFVRQQHGSERPTEHDLKVWTQLLANREHAILDRAHIRLLFEHCGRTASPAFWEELRQIGIEHGRQYRDRGIRNVEEVLRIIEAANWFHVSAEGDRSWALVLLEDSSKMFLKTFLSGFLSEYPGKPEIVEERTKLRVRLTASSPVRHGPASAV